MNKFVFALFLVGSLALLGCQKQEEVPMPKNADAVNSSSASGNPLTAPVDYLGVTVKAKNAATRTVDAASLNHALQMFSAQEGRYPKDLNELVAQRYIARIPAAPAGMRLDYDPAKGQARMVKVQ